MDEIVKAALAKWPNVPHCTGWLMLDRRGEWRMRNEAAQAWHELGTPIRHPGLIGFINRNYSCDEQGQWFFQNGPQRVYIELAYTPWVVRLALSPSSSPSSSFNEPQLTVHTGATFEPMAVFIDEEGNLLFADAAHPAQVALLHDHDLSLFAETSTLSADGLSGVFHWRATRHLPLQSIQRAEVAAHFRFVRSPAAMLTEAHAAAAQSTPHAYS